MTASPRQYWVLLALMFGTALAIRIGVTARFQGLSSPPNLSASPDAGEYELIAYNLSIGNGYGFRPGVPTASRPPGSPLAFVVPYLLFGRSFFALHWWVALLSAFTCVLVAWLGAQLERRTLGLLAGAWLAAYPGHFYYSMHFLSEPVFGFWLALSCGLSIWTFVHCRPLAAAAAGVSWGFAILTRVELILAVPIAWTALVIIASRATRRRLLPYVAVQTVVAVLLVAIWVGRNVVSMGIPTLSTQRGFAFWGAHNSLTMSDARYVGSWVSIFQVEQDTHPLKGTEVERDRQAWSYGVAAVRENLPRMPYVAVMKLWRFISPFFDTPNKTALVMLALGWILTAPFVAYGAWTLYARPPSDRPLWTVLVIPILATLVMGVIFYGSHRFRDALAPLFLVIAARGLTVLMESRGRRHHDQSYKTGPHRDWP